MNIHHSHIKNDFTSFWFDSHINNRIQYRTFLDYFSQSWKTIDIINQKIMAEGKIKDNIQLDEEYAEIQRIHSVIQEKLFK